MDTFNFSFFDDKPQESKPDAEETSSPSSSGASQDEAKTETDDDPFGFGAFDLSGADTSAEAENDDLSLNPAGSEAPASVREDDFDLSSLSSGSSADEPQNDDFSDFELSPRETFSSQSSTNEFDDLRLDAPIEAESVSFAGLDLTPPTSDATSSGADMDLEARDDSFSDLALDPQDFDLDLAPSNPDVEEANEALSMDLDDSFELSELEPIAQGTSLSEVEPLSEPKPSEAESPQIATVLPPSEPRASVTPAVFLAPTAPESEPVKKNSSGPAPGFGEPVEKAKPVRFLTADDPYGEVSPPRERLRVAMLGASGIGKNHARWFARHSCDVVSFLGSSDESVELTRSHLQAHMGFSGQGFSDLGRLLSETQPQAVCIASPSQLHYSQAMQCLEAGVHVLCEKPLVHTSARSKRENLDSARELLKAASKRNLVLGTQLQYGAATPILCRLAGVSPFEVGDFAMEIETTNPKSPRDLRELWIDLAAHPLSVAQYLAGDGAEIVPETLQIVPSRSAYTSEVSARFGVRCAGGRLLMCRVIVRWFDKIVDNREPRRRFAFNGRVVQYSGVKSPDGTYIAQYVAPDGYISHYADPVDYLIGNFVRTCWGDDELILSSELGVQNLDWLLSTAEKI